MHKKHTITRNVHEARTIWRYFVCHCKLKYAKHCINVYEAFTLVYYYAIWGGAVARERTKVRLTADHAVEIAFQLKGVQPREPPHPTRLALLAKTGKK